MILFVDNETEEIVGTLRGNKHTPEELKMWIGDKEKTTRLIVEMQPVNHREETVEKTVLSHYEEGPDGFHTPRFKKIKQKLKTFDFAYIHPQKKLFLDLDAGGKNIHDYRVDLKTNKLILKPKKIKKVS